MASFRLGVFAGVALGLTALSASASAATALPIQGPRDAAFVDTFRELVETDSSITTGSCTLVADKVEARLRAAGYGDKEITRFAVPDHPKEGGLVVVLRGAESARRPILLLGHIDVVTARREDWVRDPYTMIEEGGWFYGRGTSDMKSMDAVWIDTMIRLRREKTPPRASVKMALTCGEEASGAFNGAQWLSNNRRDLIDADRQRHVGGAQPRQLRGGETIAGHRAAGAVEAQHHLVIARARHGQHGVDLATQSLDLGGADVALEIEHVDALAR